MKNTHGQDATKLQNKQDIVQQSPDMTTNLLFRDVSKKLAILDPAKSISKTLAFDRLWKELRAGTLQAGFYIGARWINLPASFWHGVEVDRLKELLLHKKGKLRLSVAELSDYIVQATSVANGAITTDELKQLLKHSRNGFEPEITGAVWRDFLERNDLSDRPAHAKSKKGNTQKESWRDVAEFMIGYFAANRTRVEGQTSIREDMRAVRERLGTSAIGWPGESSLRDVIKAGLDTAKEIEKIKP